VTAPGHGTAQINADNTVTYTPDKTFVGSDRFAYTISNGHGGSASANVTITVQQPQGPVANDDTATTAADTPVGIDVLANDTSPAGYFLTIASVTPPSNGTASFSPVGSVTYTPRRGFVGTDTFPYSITDGHGGVASANITVTVLPPPGAFVAQNDSAKTTYATAVAINVLANDVAPAGLTLSLLNVSTPAHGTAQITATGVISYTPSASFNGGTDTFTYTVSDTLDTRTATVTVTVQAPGAPTPQSDTATTPFNKPVTINVLANDSDPQNLALSVTAVTPPAHGSAQINANNTVTYTPQSTYSGQDSFGYTISNGHGGTASANVSVTVQPPLPPIAVNDRVNNVPFCGSVKIAVLANDSDPNGLPLTVKVESSPNFGTATLNADNTITYTPDCDTSGTTTFTYSISDTYNSATATVTVTVAAALPPVAQNDLFSIQFNTPTVLNVLANDTDPQNLPVHILGAPSQPAHGKIDWVGDTITYTPNPGYTGPDSFTYNITDYFANSVAPATVTLNVQPPAQAIATDFPFSGPPACDKDGNFCDICVDGHINNPAGLSLVLSTSGTTAQGGSATTSSLPGCSYAVRYTSPDPSNPANPIDTFTYTIKDAYNRSSTGKISVTITFP
jgi:hypothetical protein